MSEQNSKAAAKYLRFTNRTRSSVLAEKAFLANNIFTRFKGLLGTKDLAAGAGLYLDPCDGIHMFWMLYAIDAIFVDGENNVLALVENIKPWQISKIYKGAKGCLELPVGTIASSGTVIGDVLDSEPVS